MSSYTKIGDVKDFPAGMMKKVSCAGEDVLITNLDGKLFAIANSCTHEGGPLDEGELDSHTVTCPWHGGKFDVTSGKVLEAPPQTDEPSYEVKIEGSEVLLRKM
jgi:nitrite reductase/ring-hydroxylating ferredoxin subunit